MLGTEKMGYYTHTHPEGEQVTKGRGRNITPRARSFYTLTWLIKAFVYG